MVTVVAIHNADLEARIMSNVTVKVSEPVEKKLEYSLKENVTADKKEYKIIDAEGYQIALFPTAGDGDTKKGSHLVANARVTLKHSGITFQMVVKKLRDSGELLAGQPARLNGHRAVVTEWIPERDAKGAAIQGKGTSFERMSLPNGVYKEIMALISDASK